MTGETRGVYLLSPAHAEGIRALSREPDVAAAAAMQGAMTPEQAAVYIAAAARASEQGRSFVFVLTDGGNVTGVCRLIGVFGVPRLIVAIGHAYRGRGNGSFLVSHVLEFAFEKLGLEQVTATGACLGIVSQFGLRSGSSALSRQEWLDWRASVGHPGA